jgi:hypothetical protein
MDFFVKLVGGLTAYVGLILTIFWLQRARWRKHNRTGKKRRGFYPSTMMLGNAFQTLQLFAQPEVRYVLREKEAGDTDEAGDGDLDDEEIYFKRQLRRIRNGEEIGVLQVRNRRTLNRVRNPEVSQKSSG